MLAAIDAALIFAPTFAPAAQEISKPTAQAIDKGESKRQENKQQFPPLLTVVGANQPIPSHTDAGIEPGDDKQQEVAIVKIPEVSLAREKKGFGGYVFDWGPWVFNLGLVIVGFLQLRLLVLTRDQIKRQADTMDTQAKDAQETGKHTEELSRQAVRQSDLTQRQLELTHRPWIAIEIVSPASDLVFDERGGVLFLNLQIRNVGNSIANHIITFVDYAVGGVTNMRDVSARVIEQLKKPIDPDLDHGKLLFPNQVDIAQYPIIILPKYIEEALQSGHFREQNGLSFELFVCFDYQSTIDPGHHYQTRCTFGVAKISPSGGPLMAIFLPSIKVYPTQQIHIFYQGRGAHAD